MVGSFIKKSITFSGLVEVVLILTSIFTITGFLGRFDFLLDQTSHFRVQYLVIQLFCLVFFLLVKRIKQALITRWPTMLPVMLIPIDHCLTSRNIVTLDRKIGANIGSDHYPIYIELGI